MASSSSGPFALPEYRDWQITAAQRTEMYGFRALFGEHLLPPAMFKDLQGFELWSGNIVQLDRRVQVYRLVAQYNAVNASHTLLVLQAGELQALSSGDTQEV